MKKVFAILAIAGFVACNSADTTTPVVDSPKVETPTVDTIKKDTMAPVVVDTTKVAAPAVK